MADLFWVALAFRVRHDTVVVMRKAMSWTWASLRKLIVVVIGPLLIMTGILLLVLPGPGLLLIAGGIALLGTEYHWARRLMRSVKERLKQRKMPPPAQQD